MNAVSVSLSQSAWNFASQQTQQRGFDDSGQYVSCLIEADQELRHELETFHRDHRERLETAVQEGLDSGDAGLTTSDDWQRLKARLVARSAKPHVA